MPLNISHMLQGASTWTLKSAVESRQIQNPLRRLVREGARRLSEPDLTINMVSKPFALLSLWRISSRLLQIPRSAAAFERSWSSFGSVYTKSRNRLKGHKVQKLVFVCSNLELKNCNLMSAEGNDYSGSSEYSELTASFEHIYVIPLSPFQSAHMYSQWIILQGSEFTAFFFTSTLWQ